MSSDWIPRAGERLGDFLRGKLLVSGGFKSVHAAKAPVAAQPSTGAGPTA